jgi:hypothetical protein
VVAISKLIEPLQCVQLGHRRFAENTTLGTVLTTVAAIDADVSPVFNTVRYFITNTNG